MNDDSSYNKLNKTIKNFNDYLAKIKNQFIITDDRDNVYFQSYNSIIVKKDYESNQVKIYLDQKYWNYSNTTGKYRNIFLGETITETKNKIKSGEYILTDLNK